MVSMPNGEGVSKDQLTLRTVGIMLVRLWVHTGVPCTYTQRKGATSQGEMGGRTLGKTQKEENFLFGIFSLTFLLHFFLQFSFP